MSTHDSETATLCKLSDSDLTIVNPDEYIRGRTVVDRDGHEIGDIDDLVIDDRESRVRFLQVGTGGFLGIGERKLMIPIDAVTRIDHKTVRIDQTREHVANAPKYEPSPVHDSDIRSDRAGDQPYWGNVYNYWGYQPYWGPGYVHPSYPHYRY